LVRLSPRPVLSYLSFYYPDKEYYSYQNPGTVDLAHHPGLRGALMNAIRNSVIASKGYPVAGLAAWQRLLQPVFFRLFRNRLPYGYGWRFPDFRPGCCALEIGCGSGAFLGILKYHGWNVVGVELSATAAAVAKDRLGVNVFVGEVQDAPFPSDSFDYVHMSHVIEHVADPLVTLRAVRRLLKPDGVVYIETPNIKSFACKRLGRYWIAWDTPRHLCLFTPETLQRTATAAGLAVKTLRTTVKDDYLWAEIYRLEERTGKAIADRPRFPNLPDFGLGVSLIRKVFQARARIAHFRTPLNGDFIHCWATRQRI
jgi:SAM-dependent methyltransferase